MIYKMTNDESSAGGLAEDPCPICQGTYWEQIDVTAFSTSDKISDCYVQLRYRVLFEIWYPEVEMIELTYVLCVTCGFVMYLPRPTMADLEAKYRFLNSEDSLNLSGFVDNRVNRIDKCRAADLVSLLRPYLTHEPSEILDVGGGDGRLMSQLVELGHRCATVDYVPKAVDGVERLGDTMDDVSIDRKFELAICSHVLEHVAEPATILRQLRAHLQESGLLFVEVPMEIWKGAPAHDEPVTHINFFTKESLQILLESLSYNVIRCQDCVYRTSTGAFSPAIRAFARRAGEKSAIAYGAGVAATRRSIHPNLWAQICWMLVHRKMLLNGRSAVRRKIGAAADEIEILRNFRKSKLGKTLKASADRFLPY